MSMRMTKCGGCGTKKPQSGMTTAQKPDGSRVRVCSSECYDKIVKG